jgi:hypothetical protein
MHECGLHIASKASKQCHPTIVQCMQGWACTRVCIILAES